MNTNSNRWRVIAYLASSGIAGALAATGRLEASLIAAAVGANVIVLLDPRIRALLRQGRRA